MHYKSIARRSLLNKLQENGDNETLELYNDLIASAGDVVVKEETMKLLWQITNSI